MNLHRAFLLAACSLASAVVYAFRALIAYTEPAARYVRQVWSLAFPAATVAEREALPSLISTETFRQGVSRAQTDSFVARRANRLAVGRGSGDPCAGLAFAA